MIDRDKETMKENSSKSGTRERARQRRRRRSREYFGLWGLLSILFFASTGVDKVYALPLTQAENPTTTQATSTSLINGASPGPTLNAVSSTTTAGSSTVSASSTITTTPGTVVTDSPLVKTSSDSSELSGTSLSQNFSSISSAFGLSSTTTNSTAQTSTILPSPSAGDSGDNDNGTPNEQTYNSLLNFYFLILAGFIGFAVLGWYLWRRRRKGKTTRDQRRGLEALRRDLELGRLRRGILGVVGRGGSNNPPTNEELPPYELVFLRKLIISYQNVQVPPSALTRPPGYEESITRPRTATGPLLHTIEEEQSIASRSETPETPLPPEATMPEAR